jgi:hypothetical protein
MWTESCQWGGVWYWCGSAAHVTRSVADCARGPPASTSASTKCLSCPVPPSSSSPTVAGCRLGGYPAGRDQWGGERVVGGVLSRINIGANVWGESGIMTGVNECWFSSTLHIRWGLCDRLCLVLVYRGRYSWGGVVLLFILGSNLGGVGQVTIFCFCKNK